MQNFDPPAVEAVTNGQFNFGIYNEPLRKVNLPEANNPLNNPLLPKYMRLKEWQAFQLGNDRYFIMVALYNAKTLALAQFIVYDIQEGKKIKFEKKVSFWDIKVANSLYGTMSYYESKNFKLSAKNDLENGKIDIEVQTNNFPGGLPDLDGSFKGIYESGKVQPQVVVLPLGPNRGMYSQKCLMHMEGGLNMGENRIDFNRDNSHLIMDDHKGYYPYVMKYDWVTGAGYDSQGRLVGFNLTDNQVKDQEKFNENCLWLNDTITLLPPVKVSRPGGVEKDWIIKDQQGKVDLVFSPVVNTRVDINLLIIRSDYHGPYGFFKGFIMNATGDKVSVDDLFGMGEQFYLRA